MGRLRHHRLLVSALVVVALLGNLAAAMLCCVPAPAKVSDYPVDLLGPMVICADHGAVAASPDADDAPPPAKSCPLCLAASALQLFLALIVAAAFFPPLIARLVALEFFTTSICELRRAGLFSRAPPLPA